MWSEFKAWWSRPFDLTNMSVTDWALWLIMLTLISVVIGLIVRTSEELVA